MKVVQSNLEISVPKSWGLATPQSNQAFTKKAKSLVKNLEKVHAKGGDFSLYVRALSKYVKSYRKSCTRNSYQEASKEVPQELVLSFVQNCSEQIGLNSVTVKDLWQNT